MYPKHRIILILISILVGLSSTLLKLQIVSISSDVISVVSISSALYLAAYAGIQASTKLRDNLKKMDPVFTHRTERYVINSYFKVALVLNLITIILICASRMVYDRIFNYKFESGTYVVDFLLNLLTKKHSQVYSIPNIWSIVDFLLNFCSTSLFTANLIQMSFIGEFVVNRIAFDK